MRIFLFIFTLLVVSQPLLAKNFLEASYYWDKRNFNTLTLQVSSTEMPWGFSMWGFTDFHSERDKARSRYDLTQSFSEYRLSNALLGDWSKVNGLELQLEVNDVTAGNSNNNIRAGITYKGKWSVLWSQFRLFPLQQKHQGQVSWAFKLDLHPRVNISGFVDGNLLDDNSMRWVAEPQLNIRLTENSWMLLEYRYNEFEGVETALNRQAWAAGLRYHFN